MSWQQVIELSIVLFILFYLPQLMRFLQDLVDQGLPYRFHPGRIEIDNYQYRESGNPWTEITLRNGTTIRKVITFQKVIIIVKMTIS